MSRYVLLAAAAVAASVPLSASAEPQLGSSARSCAPLSVTSGQLGARWYGVESGGPIVVLENGAPATARLVCSIQIDAYAHSAPDVVRVVGPTSVGVVAVPPTYVSWDATGQPVNCTQVDVDGGPSYYFNALTDEWSTDQDSACGGPRAGGLSIPLLDWAYCPVLGTVSPGAPPAVQIEPSGDVSVLGEYVNCPPYGD